VVDNNEICSFKLATSFSRLSIRAESAVALVAFFDDTVDGAVVDVDFVTSGEVELVAFDVFVDFLLEFKLALVDGIKITPLFLES